MKRYSTLNVQFSANAHSSPAPAVQPNSALFWYGRPFSARFYIRAAAAGAVDENAVPCIADTRAERSQPVARGLATQSGSGRVSSGGREDAGAKSTAAAAAQPLPIKIAFDAQYPCAELAADPHCCAD